MDYRTTITYEHPLDPDGADEVLGALQQAAAGMGPVVSIDLAEPSFSIVLATAASDVLEALSLTNAAAARALEAVGLGQLVGARAEVEPVDEHESAAA